MAYQPWLQERIERFRAFHADPTPGQILVCLALWDMDIDYASCGVPHRSLDSWDLPAQAAELAEYNVRKVRAAITLAAETGEDRVPCICADIGIALHSTYFSGAPMIIGPSTSWVHPVIHDWDDLEKLRCDEGNPYLAAISAMNRRCVELCEGDYAVQTSSHFAPMDMANALRGNDLFLDFYDSPDRVHELMRRSVEAIIWLERIQREIVPDVVGGTALWGTWVPGKAILMSEDATDLCSKDIYVEFGRPYTEQISAAMGGCWIHHHACGLHVHEEIAKVKGLKTLEISLDPNRPRPIDCLEQLWEQNNGLPLVTRCNVSDVYEKIEQMKQGRLVLMLSAKNFKEAQQAIAFIHRNTRR